MTAPITATDLAEALRSLMATVFVPMALNERIHAFEVTESLLNRFDDQERSGVTIVPTHNVGIADTGDVDECCIVCGESVEGGHEPSRCIDNLTGGEQQARDQLAEMYSSADAACRCALDVLHAWDDWDGDICESVSLEESIESLRTALTAAGYLPADGGDRG